MRRLAASPLTMGGRRLYSRTTLRLKSVDLGTKMFSLYTVHKKSSGTQKSAAEQEAWRLLEGASEEEIGQLDTSSIAEVLAAWNYFSLVWENGVNGPGKRSADVEALEFPIVHRAEEEMKLAAQTAEAPASLPKRYDPLDETLDF